MALKVISRLRSLAASLKFVLAFLAAAVREEPLRLRPAFGSRARAILTPRGELLPQIAGGAPEGDPDDDKGDKGEKGDKPEDKGGDPDDDDETKVSEDDDWKAKSRKNENRAKREEAKRKEAEEKLRKREEADETEAEKKVREAEEKGRKEAETAAQKEARSTRLESAVTKAAVKKLKVGDGDDAEEYRFADPEDAQILIDRAIAKGDLEEDDLFNEKGQVDQEVVERELAGFLKRKSHLREGGTEGSDDDHGDPDTRKGGAADGDLESLSPEDHEKRKYGTGKK